MKILRSLVCIFLLGGGSGAQAATKIATLITPLAYSGYLTQIHYYLEITDS
ncbi:fimbrial adhesin YfcO [Escherichia coli]|nr:fimbrial adhesin YfcO [Escherichia coli]